MNIIPRIRTEPSTSLSPGDIVEGLGRLQAEPPNTLGSIYIYDLVDQRTVCNSCPITTMLGYSAEDFEGMSEIVLGTLIHPDDLDRVSQHYQRFTVLHWEETISIHYRMIDKSGNWCWFRSQETPLVMASDGLPLQILGVIQPRNMEWLL